MQRMAAGERYDLVVISSTELDDLRRAKGLLEHPGLAAKLSAIAGAPVERGLKMLPKRLQRNAQQENSTTRS